MARAPTRVQQIAAHAFANSPAFRKSIRAARRTTIAHKRIARTGAVHHFHLERGYVLRLLPAPAGRERSFGSHRDRHHLRAKLQELCGNLFVIGFAGDLARRGFAWLQNVY